MIAGAVVVATVAVGIGTRGGDSPPPPPPAQATPAASPAYDETLEPAAAVLPLVPRTASALTVTDYDQVRLQLSLQEVTTESPRRERRAFWTVADAERPLLSPGMLREVDRRLEARFGFTQLDVSWEAHFTLENGDEGFVLVFVEGTDMKAVERAVDAGVGPLAGATVDAGFRMVSSGTTDDGDQSLAADVATASLVGLPANSTYLATGCLGDPPGGRLEELGGFSVQFEGTLVTARLGADRNDLFERLRLASQAPEFTKSFDGGVADPGTGRLGYRMSDPAAAAALALRGDLPFAACA